MRTIAHTAFTTVKTEGGILPPDLLQRVAAGRDLEGLRPEDYHLFPGERINEAINRAWNRCLGAWRAFESQRANLLPADRGTTLTRERWLLVLFQELGYGRLPYTGSLPLNATASESQPGTEALRYPISHRWGRVPIHLTTFQQPLDRRSVFDEESGASSALSKRSPHSLMQEFLNRSSDYLWGFVSNGLQLRLLRDNVSLTRAAYLEFDLEAMMTGEAYADFALLWQVCHQSRVEDGNPQAFWLERWSQQAADQGVRALDALRDGVQEAIVALGRGFLAHRANAELRSRLRSGALTPLDYYRQLLRMVYRLIFLFVAEERELLLVPDERTEEGKSPAPSGHLSSLSTAQRYRTYYSVSRLRELAATLRGGPHHDLYRGLHQLFTLLDRGYPPLGLPALGSFLFSSAATPDLDSAELSNDALLDAIRALTLTVTGNVRRSVDYRNLGSEELGSIYESLLELHPQLNVDAGAFDLESAAGSERKTTGSYYTPASLIQSLLDTALEPVIHDKVAGSGGDRATASLSRPGDRSPEAALLSIKVVDPACGSGHFLIAAAHRLAHHLARLRTGDEEPAPAELRAALRDVVHHCIHGVDLNPMAVELCKVALWMETLDPGKPLSFLDHNIQCGNSLVGAGPGMAITEIPDDAFRPVTGDDKATATALRRRNKRERTGQLSFWNVSELTTLEDLARWRAQKMAQLDALPEDAADQLRVKESAYQDYLASEGYREGRLLYDLWTAAFFWPIPQGDAEAMVAPTQVELNRLRAGERPDAELARRGQELAAAHRFFHWEVAFPECFAVQPTEGPGEEEERRGGFDVVLGNPPWERIKLQEKEFFAQHAPEIAEAPTAAIRQKMIQTLIQENPALYRRYQEALRDSEHLSTFLRASGHYPLTAVGDINTYQVFAGLARQLLAGHGRAGIVVPTGIATDYFNRDYFGAIVEGRELASLYDFENREGIFPGVHRSYKFSLLTLTGAEAPVAEADFAFFLTQPEQLRDSERRFTLTTEDFQRINPNTQTCPVFRTRRDADLTRAIYRRVPVLIDETTGQNPWNLHFTTMFHMSNDSKLFRTREQLEAGGYILEGNHFVRGADRYLPLYEAKMFWHFDHRFGTYEGVTGRSDTHIESLKLRQYNDPEFLTLPWYWVNQKEIIQRLPQTPEWFLAFRDITNATNERTGIFSILPWGGIGNSAPIFLIDRLELGSIADLLANLNSFAFDYAARRKVGGTHMNFFIVEQLPVLPPDTYDQPCPWTGRGTLTLHDFIAPRVLELTYTAWDLRPFAEALLAAAPPPPYRWDEERRFLLRCELDAAYFHLYGIARDEVIYIMESFPIVKRKDEAEHQGEYRTLRVILEIYDAMARSMETGTPYATPLDPPPADPRVAHSRPTIDK